jgi:hypothetical protein
MGCDAENIQCLSIWRKVLFQKVCVFIQTRLGALISSIFKGTNVLWGIIPYFIAAESKSSGI